MGGADAGAVRMSVMLIDALSARQAGGQTYLTNLLTRLPADEPAIIYLLAPEEFGRRFVSNRVRLLRPRWPIRNGFVAAAWERLFLSGYARRLEASLVFFPGGVVTSRIPLGIRVATMFRNVIPFDMEQRRRYPLGYQRMRNWLLEKAMFKSILNADVVIFLSNHARSIIERYAGRAIAGGVTIPHGVNPAFRASPIGSSRPSWVPDHPYLLYVSSYEPYKAQLEVVRAFASAVREWHQPLSLVLVGPNNTPSYAAHVKREASSLGVGSRVLLPGNRPYSELPAANHHCLINIFASEAENCPNALLEAMAAGKPILCSQRPPMPEFAGDAVWYFEPTNVDELTGLISRLLREPDTRVALGARAAEYSQRYDWDQTARRTWTALLDGIK
jgi:glycosyltransferase involved in cell wall biosynthesis